MHTFDLDEESPDAVAPGPPGSRGRRGPAGRWWAALAVLLLVVGTAVSTGADQRSRDREFSALIEQVTQGQSALRYSYARVLATVEYTSPQLTSPRTPARVRAGLAQIVQQAAADRVAPMRAHRDAVAGLSIAAWHGRQRRARDAYRTYLDEEIGFLRAVAADLHALYRPRTGDGGLAAARAALLAVSPDPASSERVRKLLV
jgi:hypothetical protein